MCKSVLLKKAHKMTKDICTRYPNIDYHAQLGLCMKALYSEQEQQKVDKGLSSVIDAFDALDDIEIESSSDDTSISKTPPDEEEMTDNTMTEEVNFGRHNIVVSTKVEERGNFIVGSVVNKTTRQRFNFYWRRKNYPAPMVKVKEGRIDFRKARQFLLRILPGTLKEAI